jgi:hypothetical protein
LIGVGQIISRESRERDTQCRCTDEKKFFHSFLGCLLKIGCKNSAKLHTNQRNE